MYCFNNILYVWLETHLIAFHLQYAVEVSCLQSLLYHPSILYVFCLKGDSGVQLVAGSHVILMNRNYLLNVSAMLVFKQIVSQSSVFSIWYDNQRCHFEFAFTVLSGTCSSYLFSSGGPVMFFPMSQTTVCNFCVPFKDLLRWSIWVKGLSIKVYVAVNYWTGLSINYLLSIIWAQSLLSFYGTQKIMLHFSIQYNLINLFTAEILSTKYTKHVSCYLNDLHHLFINSVSKLAESTCWHLQTETKKCERTEWSTGENILTCPYHYSKSRT